MKATMSPTVDSMRAALKTIPVVYPVLRAAANLYRHAARWPFERQVRRFREHCLRLAAAVPKAVFVKVGANDGLSGDPCSDILLGDSRWSGVLIEPVPHCFRRLQRNFGDSSRFRLEQVAIGAIPGKAKFYFVDE